jgi:hypothetical protein
MARSSTLVTLLSAGTLCLAGAPVIDAAEPVTGTSVTIGTPDLAAGTVTTTGVPAGKTPGMPAAIKPLPTARQDALDSQDLSQRDRMALRQEYRVAGGIENVDVTALKAAVTNSPADWPASAQGKPVNEWTTGLGDDGVVLEPAELVNGSYGGTGDGLKALPSP